MGTSGRVHRCAACGATAPGWVGRCPSCGDWNTMVAEPPAPAPRRGGVPASAGAPAVPLAEVDASGCPVRPTGIAEVDRVLDGGLVPGSLTLVFGEPGVGKSTLLLQVLAAVAEVAPGERALLVSAEESAAQVRARADRLGTLPAGLFVVATDDLNDATRAVADTRPTVAVVDSVQTLVDAGTPGTAGSLAQVRSCALGLGRTARATGCAVILVGQVTKDGDPAGPRSLEHLVDTVLVVEGDRHHSLRFVRALKHRFGATGEVGLFEMGERGLEAVADPARLLLGDRRPHVPGSAVCPLVQGRRTLLVEVQALVCGGPPGAGRSTVQGVDPRRLATVSAVLQSRAGIGVRSLDLFVSVTGGIRALEPATDLAVALAVSGAALGVPAGDDLVAFGEIGLAGEIRQVPAAERRLAEAARLGFGHALVPAASPEGPPGIRLLRVDTLRDALDVIEELDEAAAPDATRTRPLALAR